MRAFLRALLPILCAGLLPPAAAMPARADGDAGTQSVFAYGAGNRALAMGGAFVAAADDASATLWNPAGLGLAQRSQLEVVQSGDLGLGFSEVYGSAVVPSWRWGAAGLVVRHFGVGGIEQRDERNVLLADDLSDSETELALGYGRALGGSWSVGGAGKLRQHRLAGWSGSGLGLDVGVHVRPLRALGTNAPWAEQWTLGLAVHNAVEPSIRLDRESVPDPMSVRAGLAWHGPVGFGRALAEVDLDKARNVAPQVHAGLEYQLHAAAALRAGWSNGHLTAGTGLRWRDLALDYAFEDGTLASAHRVGVTFFFGSTVEQSRLAARRAEDEAIQRRLAEGFRQRQAEQVTALLRRAEEAMQAGRYDDALEALATVTTLEPAEPRAATLERACLLDKARELETAGEFARAAMTYERALAGAVKDSAAVAGAERCRLESDRRAQRSSQVRQRFAAAMDAFAAEDLAAARAGFAQVLKQDSTDAEALEMARRTEAAIRRRVTTLVGQAQRLIRAGLSAEAASLLDEAAALDANAPLLAQARAALTRAKQSAAAPRAAAAPSPAGGSAGVAGTTRTLAPANPHLDDGQVEDLYQRGLTSLKAQRTDDAVRYWELVWSARPGYRGVGEFLKREYLARGMESFASGRLEEASGLWEKVLQIDPGDVRARGYLVRAQKQLERSRDILSANP
jgi:tetratricopeptide (TPR) repeat protein